MLLTIVLIICLFNTYLVMASSIQEYRHNDIPSNALLGRVLLVSCFWGAFYYMTH